MRHDQVVQIGEVAARHCRNKEDQPQNIWKSCKFDSSRKRKGGRGWLACAQKLFYLRCFVEHNYAHECVEVLVKSKYKLTSPLRTALEKSWFVNRWGKPGRWIASSLYLNSWTSGSKCIHKNVLWLVFFECWTQRVFITQGSGVTMKYIIKKSSACVKAFCDISHIVANIFGDPDFACCHKEPKFQENMQVLDEEMVRHKLHILSPNGHFVPAPLPKNVKASTKPTEPQPAIVNVIVLSSQVWHDRMFSDLHKGTTYDPALGYPVSSESASNTLCRNSVLDNRTVFNHAKNPLDFRNYKDLHGNEVDTDNPRVSSLSRGDEFRTGNED